MWCESVRDLKQAPCGGEGREALTYSPTSHFVFRGIQRPQLGFDLAQDSGGEGEVGGEFVIVNQQQRS